MKKILFLIAFLFFMPSVSWGVPATGCSNAEIQTAINNTANGGTVDVPACTETNWNGSVTIPSTKGITLQGAGTINESTGEYSGTGSIINMGTNLLYVKTKDGNAPTRVTGFHFKHTDGEASGSTWAVQVSGENDLFDYGAKNWRIDHNYFQCTRSAGGSNSAIGVFGYTYGLIDNNRFTNHGRTLFFEGGDELEAGYGLDAFNTSKEGQIEWGNSFAGAYPKAIYVEHNWSYGDKVNGQFIDGNWGIRVVLRYNYITDCGYIQAHFGGTSGPAAAHGVVHYEVYGNTLVHSGDATCTAAAMFYRSGTYIVYNNTFVGTYGSGLIKLDYRIDTGCDSPSANNPWFPSQCGTPICRDQIGTGPDASSSGTTSHPAYFWNNRRGGTLAEPFVDTCGDGVIRLNTDYFSSDNTPKSGYTAYQDPHALNSGVPQEDVTPPVVTSNTLHGTELSCTSDPRDVTVPIGTNENATCRISTTDQTFAAMTSAKNMSGAGGMTHTSLLTGLDCSASYTRYVRCQDTAPALNTMTTSSVTTFSIAAAATSEAPIMSGQIPTTGSQLDCSSNPRDVGLELITNKDATCKYSTTDQAYATMGSTYNTPVASPLARSGRWLYYNGSPIWIVGYDLQQLFNDATYNEAAVKVYIDAVAATGATAFRVWLNTWFLGNAGTDYYPYTYSGGKFNLGTFSSTFFDRWKVLIAYAKTKGLMVEVAIFTEYPNEVEAELTYWNDPTNSNYWRADENNQGYFSDVSGDFWPQFYTWNYTEGAGNLTTIQKALVAKVVFEFNPIGNVFFLIANEFPNVGGGNSSTGEYVDQVYEWQQQMADYAKSLGAITFVHGHEYWGLNTQGIEYWNTRASVDGMAFHPYSTKATDANIDEINTMIESQFSMDKVLIFDESHDYDAGDAEQVKAVVREMFASFVNGVYYLAYWDDPFTVGDADFLTKAGAVTTLKNISALVNWPEMTHNNYLVSAGPGPNWQCSGKTGEYYVCYFTGTPAHTDAPLTLPAGTYDYTWYLPTAWDADGILQDSVISTGGATNIPHPDPAGWDTSYGVVMVVIRQGVSPVVGTQTHNATESLACGQTHTFYSRCTDGVNTNTSSAVTTFGIVSDIPSPWTEAESGTLAGAMSAVADANASGGYYIQTSAEMQGTATFTVNVPVAGTYRIVARFYAADSGSDSYFLQINSLPQIIWPMNYYPAVPEKYNVWLVAAIRSVEQDPYQVTLTEGNHTFVFSGREVGARLDYFYLVSMDVTPIPPEPTGLLIIGAGATMNIGAGGTLLIP